MKNQMLRTWHVTERSVRPDHRMIAHSGFLTTVVRCEPKPTKRVPLGNKSPAEDLAEGPEEAGADGRDG